MRTVRVAAATAALALGLTAWTPYAVVAAAQEQVEVDLGGQPVVGSTNSTTPTTIEAGLWSATLGPDPQHFSYERQLEDSTIHVGVIGAPQPSASDDVNVAASVVGEDESVIDCGSDYETSSEVPQGVIGAQVIVGNEDDCSDADAVAIAVSRNSGASTDLPIAIKIVEEAPVADAEDPPAESPELDYEEPEPAEPVDGPAGAPSFEDAPVIDPREGAVTIALDLVEGTELLWRVPLEWGDQLVARADLPGLSDRQQEQLEYATATVRLRIIQPIRDTLALTESEHYHEDTYGDVEASSLFVGTYPLRYANRYTETAPYLPGDHWVSLAVAPTPEDRDPIDVPVELTVAVGTTDVPTPTYKAAVLAQSGGDGPEGYSADTPYLVGDGEFSAVASGNPFTPESEEDDSWWGPQRFAGVGLGAVSLVCCAVGAVWLVRRRAR